MVPQIIQDLVSRALKDGVLTYKERQVIMEEAGKMNADPNEVSQYINTALDNRLSYIPKESLKRCPTCGAQIPLLSNQCEYCGFEFGEDNAGGTSHAEKVIDLENRNTNSEYVKSDAPLRNCPDCGAPFPLISNICPSCGHIEHERADSKLNIKTLIENTKKSIDTMGQCMVPLWKSIIRDNALYLLPIAGIMLSLSKRLETGNEAYTSMSGVPMLMAFLLMGYTAIALIFRINAGSALGEADKKFNEQKTLFDMYTRHTDTLYGAHKEARELLDKFGREIRKVKLNRIFNRMVYYIFCIVSCLIIWNIISTDNDQPAKDDSLYAQYSRYIPCGATTSKGALAVAGNMAEASISQDIASVSQGYLAIREGKIMLGNVRIKPKKKIDTKYLAVIFWNGNGEVIPDSELKRMQTQHLDDGQIQLEFMEETQNCNSMAIINTAKSFSIILLNNK